MCARRILLLAACSVVASHFACFNPAPRTGLTCSESSACPPGQDCVAGVCTADSSSGDGDIDTDLDGGASTAAPFSLEPRWVRTISSPGDDVAWACDIDADGSVYAAGHYSDQALFEGRGVLIGSGEVASNGGHDMFLLRYTGDGDVFQFAGSEALFTFGDTSNDRFNDVIVTDGMAIAGGYFAGSVNFGGPNDPVAAQSHDGIVVAFDTTVGGHQWETRGTGATFGGVTEMAASGDRLYVTGRFGGLNGDGGLTVGGCDELVSLAATADEIYVANLDLGNNGDCLGAYAEVGGQADRGMSIAAIPAVDGENITGAFAVSGRQNGVDVDATGHDLWIARYDAETGIRGWQVLPTPSESFEEAAAVVASNAIICGAGRFNGSLAFSEEDTFDAAGTMGGYVVCRDAGTGDHLWAEGIVATENVYLDSADRYGDAVVVAGRYGAELVIGDDTLVADGSRDGLIVGYDMASGDEVSVTTIGGDGTIALRRVRVVGDQLCVAGQFDGNLVIGTDSKAGSGGSTDGFVALFDIVDAQ